jgi:hypothetical protein
MELSWACSPVMTVMCALLQSTETSWYLAVMTELCATMECWKRGLCEKIRGASANEILVAFDGNVIISSRVSISRNKSSPIQIVE